MKVKFEYKKLRQQREALKMSQFRLAELADTSDRYIRGMESGKKTNPSVAKFYRLCRALGQPMEAFLTVSFDDEDD